VKSERAFRKENIESLNILSNPVSRNQERILFYAEIQATKSRLDSLREEADISKLILRFSNGIAPSTALKLAKIIREDCDNYGLDPFLILAMIEVESQFSPKAVSSKGAIGLMQITPETGEFVAGELGLSINGSKSLYNPFINVRFGIYYLYLLINRFKSVEWALLAYNTGPNSLISSEKGLSAYVRKVIRLQSWLRTEMITAEQS
jgi:soluble lytic murein transglycosylase-like protein